MVPSSVTFVVIIQKVECGHDLVFQKLLQRQMRGLRLIKMFEACCMAYTASPGPMGVFKPSVGESSGWDGYLDAIISITTTTTIMMSVWGMKGAVCAGVPASSAAA